MSSQISDDPSVAFALRLGADLLTAMVVTRQISRASADKLVNDALSSLIDAHAEHEPALRKIAVTLKAQVALALIEMERLEAESGS